MPLLREAGAALNVLEFLVEVQAIFEPIYGAIPVGIAQNIAMNWDAIVTTIKAKGYVAA